MKKLVFIIITVISSLLIPYYYITDGDDFYSLLTEKNINNLVYKGWLPKELKNISINKGKEVHNLDNNRIFLFLDLMNTNDILKYCKLLNKKLDYPKTPYLFRKDWNLFRKDWIKKDDFLNLKIYNCFYNFHMVTLDKKAYLWSQQY